MDGEVKIIENQRVALFISHANPEDNPFTIWLGAKLAALGYEVWADVLRLRGGDDWQRILEQALRQRARKVLLVANPISVDKQGVRNELQIATTVGRTVNDGAFIIPLRLAPFDAPFLVAHAQYIDFQNSWAQGLSALLETLEDAKVAHHSSDANRLWTDLQLIHAKSVIEKPERLVSNWLSITRLPTVVCHYDFKRGAALDNSLPRIQDAPWPCVPYRHGFLSFASRLDLREHFGSDLPIKLMGRRSLSGFLDAGWKKLGISQLDARNKFSDLARQTIERRFREKCLSAYFLSSRRIAWWPPVDIAPKERVSFRWPGISGQRQIQGRSEERQVNWHFGVSVAARTAPLRHVRLISRIIFTIDGHAPLSDSRRMHRLRRSFAKSWRNPRWRDMLLAFLYWLSSGSDQLIIPASSTESLVLSLPPISWSAPVSMPADVEDLTKEEESDDDDSANEESLDFEQEQPEEPGDEVEEGT